MTDRELMEAAAKAAGLRHVCYAGLDYDGRLGLQLVDGIGRHTDTWNPLADDGDALRLMVVLCIRTEPMASYCVAYAGSVCAEQFAERSGDDRPAAMRRAIVRAAAAMGATAGKV